MNWPFAWSSTVRRLKAERDQFYGEACQAQHELFCTELDRDLMTHRANDWIRRTEAAYKRIAELADPSRMPPEVMAEVFLNFDEKQVATFFNLVGDACKNWKWPSCMKWSAVKAHLSGNGHYEIENIARSIQ